jgi:ribosomal protein L37AE/L43A
MDNYLPRKRGKIVNQTEESPSPEQAIPDISKKKSQEQKLCPDCGEIMQKQYDGSWRCPMCGPKGK